MQGGAARRRGPAGETVGVRGRRSLARIQGGDVYMQRASRRVREAQRKASGRGGKEHGLVDGTCCRGPPWRGSGAGRNQRRRESAVEKLQAASLSPVRANREGEM